MKILHICNDFSYSKVHSNLHRNLDNIGLQQVVFHPLRDKNRTDINVFKFNVKGSEIKYSRLLKNYHRLLFHKKINFLFDDIKNNINLESVDIQYATTLFSDGALAYKIYKKYKTPYIVALRNTDINLFLKVRPDLYILGKNILMNAQKIIFLSPSLKELFFSNNYFAKFKHQLNHRIKIIPNGIDNYWLGNLCTTNAKSSNKFLFVGRFDRNKNIISLIKSLEKCKHNVADIELNLIGGDGNLHNEVLNLIQGKHWINYHGKVYDKYKLIEIFRMNDFFAMPSIHESFGLVYIEALSQGLPILFTKGQGVDGLFDIDVGIGTDPMNEEKIADDLMWMISNRKILYENIQQVDFSLFDWKRTAQIYKSIFEEILQ